MGDVASANTDREVGSLLKRLFGLATAQPEAVALQFPGGRLTYQEMANAVDALARRLAALGVARRDIVAIEGGKAPASYLLMFAAWRLGAVALPIDNSLPPQRRADMRKLAAFQAFVVEGDAGHQHSNNLTSIRVSKEGIVVTTPEAMAPIPYSPAEIASTEPAYVVFTSGTSGGEPKAAIGTHAGLWNFASWQMESLPAGRAERVAQIASLSFDAMFKDVTLAIGNGATLMVPFDRPLDDADAVLNWIEFRKGYGGPDGSFCSQCMVVQRRGGEAFRSTDALPIWRAPARRPYCGGTPAMAGVAAEDLQPLWLNRGDHPANGLPGFRRSATPRTVVDRAGDRPASRRSRGHKWRSLRYR